MGAEIDCYRAKDQQNHSRAKAENDEKGESKTTDTVRDITLGNYVELKTCKCCSVSAADTTDKLVDSGKADHTWRRYKLLKFWIQSFIGRRIKCKCIYLMKLVCPK